MFLHLGQDTVINDREIIGIFDMDKTTISKATFKLKKLPPILILQTAHQFEFFVKPI